MTKIIYCDVESTGLDPTRHVIWEMAYAVGDGPIRSSFVQHNLHNADPVALEIGRYDKRAREPMPRYADMLRFEDELREELDGATIVGANPAFDAAMLFARWHVAPWHYRVLDVECYAMPALGLAVPRGLAFLCEVFGVLAPDHSAAGDVRAVREVHQALVEHYASARASYEHVTAREAAQV